MLSICNGSRYIWDWHIGEAWPVPNDDLYEPVKWVQADGHELSAIAKQFPNLPCCTSPVIRWTGEWAQFIADNFQPNRATLY